MFKISFKYKLRDIDESVEKLNIEDIYNMFYSQPFELIENDNETRYEEIINDDMIDASIIVEEDSKDELERVINIVKRVLNLNDEDLSVEKVENIF